MPSLPLIAHVALVGIAATAVMDAWLLLLARLDSGPNLTMTPTHLNEIVANAVSDAARRSDRSA